MYDYYSALKTAIDKDFNANVLHLLPYGSQVYGTNGNLSDKDFIVVLDTVNVKEKEYYILKGTKFDCEIVSSDVFTSIMAEGSVKFIEAAMFDNNWKSWNTLITPNKIQQAFVEKAQKSWNKALNNLHTQDWSTVTLNAYHAVRIMNFLIQIKNKGIIFDYTQAKEVKQKLHQIENEEEFNFFVKPWFEELFAIVQEKRIDELC